MVAAETTFVENRASRDSNSNSSKKHFDFHKELTGDGNDGTEYVNAAQETEKVKTETTYSVNPCVSPSSEDFTAFRPWTVKGNKHCVVRISFDHFKVSVVIAFLLYRQISF